MAQELLRYQPIDGSRDGWLARIAKLATIYNKDLAQGFSMARGLQICLRGNKSREWATPTSHLPRRWPHVPPRRLAASQVATSSSERPKTLEHRWENHDRAIDNIEEMGKNINVYGELVYDPRCLTLIRPLRYVVSPDKLWPDVATRYDGSSNFVYFLQLYIIAVQAARGDQCVMANWFPMALKDAARTWPMNLPPESVTSWRDLCWQFVADYMPTYERPAMKDDLKAAR
jgi:hypothetical protein